LSELIYLKLSEKSVDIPFHFCNSDSETINKRRGNMIEFKERYTTWRENIKLAMQGAALGACIVGIYFLFCLWGAV